jgi:hypothetical protein
MSSGTLIPQRRRHHLLDRAAGETYPTIYKPQAQIEGPATLPSPRRPEREETDDLAVGRARDLGLLPFASTAARGRRERKVGNRLC